MKIINGEDVVHVNTTSNWPLMVDLFMKWGYPEPLLEQAKKNDGIHIKVLDIDKVTLELSAWGIPWKRI